MPYIYKIINQINDKIYIGKTSHLTLNERFQEHISDSLKSHREKRPLYDAFRKYGIENFSIELIEQVENDEIASERERYWIKELNTYIGFNNSKGYNATLGGDGKRLYDYETLAKEYLNLGTVKAVCQKYQCDMKTVQQACKEYNIEIKKAPNQRKIQSCDKNGNIKIYDSVTEAARDFPNKDTETARQHIYSGLTKNRIAYGRMWKYV